MSSTITAPNVTPDNSAFFDLANASRSAGYELRVRYSANDRGDYVYKADFVNAEGDVVAEFEAPYGHHLVLPANPEAVIEGERRRVEAKTRWVKRRELIETRSQLRTWVSEAQLALVEHPEWDERARANQRESIASWNARIVDIDIELATG